MRILILRWASHLDAFSGYPFRTWLPGGAAGATTGTPEVRPSRSSRTMGKPLSKPGLAIRAVVDHHVDRPGVEAQQCVKLTGTNC